MAGADWYAPGDLVHQSLSPVAQLLAAQGEGQQAYAAVDVVAHAAGRDDAVGWLGGGHPSHREPIALMDVRHGQGRSGGPRQRGHVLDLLQRVI